MVHDCAPDSPDPAAEPARKGRFTAYPQAWRRLRRVGGWIELAVERAPAPTTDRQDGGRLQRSFEAERHVRAVGGPSLWVIRGRASGAAVPVPYEGLSCGSGAGDALSLSDAGIAPGHFTVRRTGEGDVWLTAREPVRVRGIPVHEARLGAGRGFSVATLNLDHAVQLRRNPAFRSAYAAHSHVTADGNPVVWLSRLAGQREVSLVPGSELIAPLAREWPVQRLHQRHALF